VSDSSEEEDDETDDEELAKLCLIFWSRDRTVCDDGVIVGDGGSGLLEAVRFRPEATVLFAKGAPKLGSSESLAKTKT